NPAVACNTSRASEIAASLVELQLETYLPSSHQSLFLYLISSPFYRLQFFPTTGTGWHACRILSTYLCGRAPFLSWLGSLLVVIIIGFLLSYLLAIIAPISSS